MLLSQERLGRRRRVFTLPELYTTVHWDRQMGVVCYSGGCCPEEGVGKDASSGPSWRTATAGESACQDRKSAQAGARSASGRWDGSRATGYMAAGALVDLGMLMGEDCETAL